MKFVFSILILMIGSISVLGIETKSKIDFFSKNIKESELSEITIYNGKVNVLRYNLDVKNKSFDIVCNNVKVPKRIIGEQVEIILWAGYYSPDTTFFCDSIHDQGKTKILKINVIQYAYKETTLTAQPGKVFLTAKNQARVAKEQKMLNALYAKRTDDLLFSEPFMTPLSSERTSIYGDKRIFNKKHPSTHLGNDFRAPEGTAVPAANKGNVVYVGNLFYSGNTVIIDHGMQLFSMYAHLSKIQTQLGQVVNKGDIIGLSGASGRVSGPHLHWGVKIMGDWIDGFSLVEEYNALGNDKK